MDTTARTTDARVPLHAGRHELTHTLDIAAPVERVWQLTLDIEAWPTLSRTTSGVERLDAGPLVVGSRARVRQPLQRPATWTVDVVEAPLRFEWSTQRRSGLRLVARHLIEPTGSGCRLTLVVGFEGRGAGVARRLLGPAVRRSLAMENEGFRRAAEVG